MSSHLQKLREKRGWSVAEAARRLQVSQGLLRALEAGEVPISPEDARALLRVYGDLSRLVQADPFEPVLPQRSGERVSFIDDRVGLIRVDGGGALGGAHD